MLDPNIALYTKTNNLITNSSNLTVGKNSIGIYGYGVNNSGDITVEIKVQQSILKVEM